MRIFNESDKVGTLLDVNCLTDKFSEAAHLHLN